ncbi:HEAT repeat-containing protein 5B [Trifolium medium]|uniref:HEAT repeat-containing protein 5B n=1 Tax=Trifolium medium TaxID=97028 RepID=A0A392QXP9_9FABA|nr:HEAT repeat-containing protein 5B [Trifolium medium]
MLRNALEGSGGSAASTAYSEAFRLIMRSAAGDKSFAVRIASARCLKAFASIGGPGLGVTELDNSASYCVKAVFFTCLCTAASDRLLKILLHLSVTPLLKLWVLCLLLE